MHSRAPAIGALLLAFVAALVLAPSMPSAIAQSANGVMATYIHYDGPSVKWDLRAVSASCAALDGDKPFRWRERYWWTAFCGPVGPDGDGACGMCLQVTNTATGVSATVRIVVDCGETKSGVALWMDTPVFYQMDAGDGRGMSHGYLDVNYQFVNCND